MTREDAGTALLSVVYSSTAVVPFSDHDLFELLEHSRENNARDGLTGMLLYRDERFLQVLEGPEEAVRRLRASRRRPPTRRRPMRRLKRRPRRH